MKRNIALILASMLCVSILAGCGGGSGSTSTPSPEGTTTVVSPTAEQPKDTSSPETGAKYTIKVGASPAPHAIMLELIQDELRERGVEMEIIQFQDYVQPNVALSNGDIDANFFQHINYLEQYNEDNGTDLVSMAGIHFEPMAVYPGKSDDFANIADGAEITVPNDGTNEARALQILESEGLIKIKEGVGLKATVQDIVDNPKNLKITELEAAQLPRSLADVDFAIINGNYAISSGLSMDDAVAIESADQAETMINAIVIRKGEEEREDLKLLVEVLCSENVRKFLEEEYGGSVVPVFAASDIKPTSPLDLDGEEEDGPTHPSDEADLTPANQPTSPADEAPDTDDGPNSPADE